MQKPSEPENSIDDWEEQRRRVIGLGENSFRKSYYPELRRNVANVKNLLLAIERSPRGLFVSLRDGEVEYINQMLLTLSGCDSESLVGRRPHALWSNVIEGARAATVMAKMAAGESWDGDLLIDDGKGPPRWVHMMVAPIFDDTGDITHFLGSMEDISARKQAEEELRAVALARTQALEAAEHLSALKSQFIANMSHELRTPIFQILSLARLSARAGDIDRARQQAEKIKECGDRLMQIVQTLLDFSAVEGNQLALQKTTFSLSAILDNLQKRWQSRVTGKNLEFAVDGGSVLDLQMHSDQQRIEQLLDELIGNALKFTSQGFIKIRAAVAPGGVQLAVMDSGIGMTAAQADQCLHAFVQGDGSATRRYGGMGLGLALVRHLVELLEGQMDVVSCPDQGSTFTIHLPLLA